MKFLFERVENIVGNGENAGYQQISHIPQCFLQVVMSGSLTLYQTKNVSRIILESACPSLCSSMCLSVYKVLVSIKALVGINTFPNVKDSS